MKTKDDLKEDIKELKKLRDRLVSVPGPITEEYLEAHGWKAGCTSLGPEYRKETNDYVIEITLLPNCDKYAGIICWNKNTGLESSLVFSDHSALKFKEVKGCFTFEDLYNLCRICGIKYDELQVL